MNFLMCNSFLLIHVEAVLRYFRSLYLPKKRAVAGILPNQATHRKALLREYCLPLFFLTHVWMPGIQTQNEMTRETGHYEGRTDCHALFQLLFLSMAKSTLCCPHWAVAHLAHRWQKQRGIWALSCKAQQRHNKSQPQSESFSPQITNAVSK